MARNPKISRRAIRGAVKFLSGAKKLASSQKRLSSQNLASAEALAKTAAKTTIKLWRPLIEAMPTPSPAGRVVEVEEFGPNPGGLRMAVYTPREKIAPKSPLIVVLHGCGQTAAGFAASAGFIALAERLNIPLLLPEQDAKNNRGRCFNWYAPEKSRRGVGEAASIRAMVRAATRRFDADPKRIFIVGLSAGAAMAANLLAAYPSSFAGGALVAGMPVGAASNAPMALLRMRRAAKFSDREALAQAVRRAAPATRSPRAWPKISIWQGGKDKLVDPRNAEALAAQWSAVHGFGATPDEDVSLRPGLRHRVWRRAGRPLVEYWTVAELEHGFPIDAQEAGHAGFGAADIGLSAARLIAQFWGL